MKAEECLRKSGIKVTKGRVNVLQFFLNNKSPLSADEIYLSLRKNDIKIDLSTIYRTLELLEEKNILSKIIGENNRYNYILKESVHKHKIECSVCHKEVEYACPMPQIKELLKKETGFYVTCGDITLEGICDECKDKNNK